MDEARGHARWVRVSHWIGAASLLAGRDRRRDPDGAPAPLLGRGGQRPHAGAARAADQPEPPARRLGHAAAVLRPRRRAGQRQPDLRHLQPERVGTQPALPRGVVPRRARRASICSAGCSADTSARTSGPARASWRRAVSCGATSSITCACGFRPRRAGRTTTCCRRCAYSLVVFVAAPLMVLTGLAMSPAVGRGVAVAAAPVRWLPVGAHDPFLRVRGARAVRARARRDGRRSRASGARCGR